MCDIKNLHSYYHCIGTPEEGARVQTRKKLRPKRTRAGRMVHTRFLNVLREKF